jgi:hypothetical protein
LYSSLIVLGREEAAREGGGRKRGKAEGKKKNGGRGREEGRRVDL